MQLPYNLCNIVVTTTNMPKKVSVDHITHTFPRMDNAKSNQTPIVVHKIQNRAKKKTNLNADRTLNW